MMYSEEASQISGNGSIVGFQIIEIQCTAVTAKWEWNSVHHIYIAIYGCRVAVIMQCTITVK